MREWVSESAGEGEVGGGALSWGFGGEGEVEVDIVVWI